MQVLRVTEKPMAPLLVVPVGKRFFVVDGHQRLKAYRTVLWSRPVPVEVFPGGVEAAWLEGVARNVQNKLHMTLEDKLEVAWRMVTRTKMPKGEIAARAVIAERTVGNMRAARKRLEGEGQDPREVSWWQAKRDRPKKDIDIDEWRQREVKEIARRLLDTFGPTLRKRPDFLAEALGVAYPGLPKVLIEQWPEEVREMTKAWEEAEF